MIWYPYAQMKTMAPPLEIVNAQGVYLYTRDEKLVDSIGSWWSVIHGYNHPELTRALVDQAQKFSHVMLGGLTHEPARLLAQKLESYLPGDLDYCFFSDSGSVAVEVALKMALQYYMNMGGARRTMVMALEHAYHGDTFKAMEVGDDEDYHFVLKAYGESPNVVKVPTRVEALERAFERYHERLNCLIVEPLLQGAGGMRMYGLDFLRRARQLCDQYGVLLIFDEVATGFGRTGRRFVADLVTPDILVLGYRVGARLLYADTLQYHPTGVAFPSQIYGALVTEKVRSLGAMLVNREGEAFMHPLETRDVAAASIIRECTERHLGVDSEEGQGVWLDTPMIEQLLGEGAIEARIPGMLRMFSKYDIDIRKVPILVYPTLHYQNGGLEISADGQSTVENLFVAGEAVGGIHGRNRLMGNSLLDIIVFGRNAGQQAAKKSREVKVGKLTLAHVDAFAEELSKAGIQPDTVSPRLLPTYTHGREKAIEGIAVK